YLQEILELCDRITVLRDGAHIVTLDAEDASEELLVRHMLAKASAPTTRAATREHRPVVPEDARLEVRNLSGEGFTDVSIALAPGEVLGLVGLVGAGHIEFAEALFSAAPRTAGEVLLDGKPLRARTPREALASGVCLVPDQRMRKALLAEWSVRENLSLVHLGDVRLAG